MLESMTAYARVGHDGPWGQITWECRSVNHRYLEMSIKSPEILRPLEAEIRGLIKEHLNRGKVECAIKYTPNPGREDMLSINEGLLKNLINCEQQVGALQNTTRAASAIEWMRWPEVIAVSTMDLSAYSKDILAGLNDALLKLKECRAKEGQALHAILMDKLEAVEKIANSISERMPALMSAQKAKIEEKLQSLSVNVERDRLEQEMVLLMQKWDVQEEIDRLQVHCKAVHAALKKGSPVGRRLDFLMQELNREANTLSSKSFDANLTELSVELKVLIEQMREQIQNVE